MKETTKTIIVTEPITTTKKVYVAGCCGAEFDNRYKCIKHENNHYTQIYLEASSENILVGNIDNLYPCGVEWYINEEHSYYWVKPKNQKGIAELQKICPDIPDNVGLQWICIEISSYDEETYYVTLETCKKNIYKFLGMFAALDAQESLLR